MAVCSNPKYVGKVVTLEYAFGCGDTLPTAGDWKRVGAMRTKEWTLEWDTIDATADDSVGGVRENLASFQTAGVSGDGVCRASGAGSEDLIALTKYVAQPAGGQPTVWLRMTFPDITVVFYGLVTTMSRSMPYDDVVTYSFEASATASDFGVIITDTPQPVAPTGVTIDGLTTIAEGATITLTATVAPAGAAQTVTWTSSAAGTATVSSSGVVTGVAAGTATITATSTVDPSKSATHEVTVTEP